MFLLAYKKLEGRETSYDILEVRANAEGVIGENYTFTGGTIDRHGGNMAWNWHIPGEEGMCNYT